LSLVKRIETALAAAAAGRVDAKRGNAQRDRGAWSEAVAFYRRHLERRPADARIWVQLGNCAKEMGDFVQADAAYGRAIALRGAHADAHLQRGHLLKLMGRADEALASYRRAVALDPKNTGARSEMQAAEQEAASSDAAPLVDRPARTVLWLDLTDLVDYARVHLALGGIQRVVANLAIHPLGSDPAAVQVVSVVVAYRRSAMFALDPATVRELVRLLETGEGGRAALDRAIRALEATRRAALPQRGDVFVAAGAFWLHPFDDFVATVRRRGALFCLFLHDLIQIRNPEYVAPMATVVFRRQLVNALTLANLVLTNSAFVAAEVRAFAADHLDFTVPVEAVPLATALRRAGAAAGTPQPAIERIGKRDFVLCVCTIEARKNHKYLFAVWERLRRERPGQMPDLVFVGGWVWDVADLRATIERSGALGDWLHIVSGISDDDLDHLYRTCLFTAYVSFVEGFGLPVGESLAHAKPCIASGTTSLPEVGGDFARYVDPFDVEDGVMVFRQTLSDRPGLAAWTARIAAGFRPRGWDAFGVDFFDRIIAAAAAMRPGAPIDCHVPPGPVVFMGLNAFDGRAGAPRALVALGMARNGGWHALEEWGAWTAAERARLDIRSPLPEGTPITAYLRLRRPDYSPADAAIRIRIGDVETWAALPATDRFVPAKGRVGPDGAVTIDLVAAGESRPSRDRYIGFSALAYCASDDVATRLDLMEAMLFGEAR
jgi:glycosyltransferase involved in cell wall biosynthesis